MPGVELRRGIGTQEEGELAAGLALPELVQGVDGVGWPGAVQLDRLDSIYNELRLLSKRMAALAA